MKARSSARGLAGHGQTDLLLQTFAAAGRRAGEVTARVALVAGDRQSDGIFPQWSISRTSASARSPAPRRSLISPRLEAALAKRWRERIKIRTRTSTTTSCRSPAAISRRRCSRARSASDAAIVLMDDPMRGVRLRHQARGLRSRPRGGARRPHLPLVHHRNRGIEELRPRLCLSRRRDRRPSDGRRTYRGARHSFLVRRRALMAGVSLLGSVHAALPSPFLPEGPGVGLSARPQRLWGSRKLRSPHPWPLPARGGEGESP